MSQTPHLTLVPPQVDPAIGFQEPLLTSFLDLMHEEIADAQMRSKYDDGVITFKPLSLRIANSIELYRDPETSATATLHALMARAHPVDTIPWAEAQHRIKTYVNDTGKSDARYVKNLHGDVQIQIPVVHKKFTPEPLTRVLTPGGTYYQPKTEQLDALVQDIDTAEAQTAWEAQLSDSLPPERKIFAVCGLLLPIWFRLPQSTPTIYRMRTDDGILLIGRIINTWDIASVITKFELPAHPDFTA